MDEIKQVLSRIDFKRDYPDKLKNIPGKDCPEEIPFDMNASDEASIKNGLLIARNVLGKYPVRNQIKIYEKSNGWSEETEYLVFCYHPEISMMYCRNKEVNSHGMDRKYTEHHDELTIEEAVQVLNEKKPDGYESEVHRLEAFGSLLKKIQENAEKIFGQYFPDVCSYKIIHLSDCSTVFLAEDGQNKKTVIKAQIIPRSAAADLKPLLEYLNDPHYSGYLMPISTYALVPSDFDPGLELFLVQMPYFEKIPSWHTDNGSEKRFNALHFAKDTACALAELSSLGFVHLDVKPENMFYSVEGSKPKIILGDINSARTVKSQYANTIHSTSALMSPELRAHEPYDYSTDVFSWAMTMLREFVIRDVSADDIECIILEEIPKGPISKYELSVKKKSQPHKICIDDYDYDFVHFWKVVLQALREDPALRIRDGMHLYAYLEGESSYSVISYQSDINSRWIRANFSQEIIEIIKTLVDKAEFDSDNSTFINSRKEKVIADRPWGGNYGSKDKLFLLETSDSYIFVENLCQVDKYCFKKILKAGKTEICNEKQLRLLAGQIVKNWYQRGRYDVVNDGWTKITLISNGNRSYDLDLQEKDNSKAIHIPDEWFVLLFETFLVKLLTLFPKYMTKTELAYLDTLEKLRRKPGLNNFLGFEPYGYIPVQNMEPGTWGHVSEPSFVISQNQSLNNKLPQTDYDFSGIEEAAAYSKSEVIVRGGISEWSKDREFMTSLFVTNRYPNKGSGISEAVYMDERDDLPYFIVLQYDGQMCAQTWYLDKVQLTFPDVAALAEEESEELYLKYKDFSPEKWNRMIPGVDKEKIREIVDGIDFSYAEDRNIGSRMGEVIDSIRRGDGPRHEENYLLFLDQKENYIFAEEAVAPTAGYFVWKILTVKKSDICNEKELSYLKKSVIEKWEQR